MNLDINIAAEQLLILFEQHLFILADPFVADDLPPIIGDYVKSSMDFTGDVNGQFVMLFPEGKTKEVIGNFLGLSSDDPEICEMSSFDAASEILNILGAHILSSWLNEMGQFKIGLPFTTVFKSDEQSTFLSDRNITGILIEGEPVFLKIVSK